MVDLNAEAVNALGAHLSQIGDIISKSVLPPERGQKGAAMKVKDKLEIYKKYSEDVLRRKAEIEKKMREDFERLRAWRKAAGIEGAGLLEELEALYAKVRALKNELEEEHERLEEEREKVRELILEGEKKDRKWASLAAGFSKLKEEGTIERYLRAAQSSWMQCSFDEIRFKWAAEKERSKLMLEHHQRMRKARAQGRIDVIQRERSRRLMQMTVLALQEEAVEGRAQRILEQLRQQHADAWLIMQAQLAQALGDEEKSKALVAEQVRRIEAAKAEAREFERKMKLAQKEAREQKQLREQAEAREAEAKRRQLAAEKRAEIAEANEKAARKAQAEAESRAEVALQARMLAERKEREAEDAVRKKTKKIMSLQRMLAELGAESDSDAPPDERAPAFFVNEDGSKAPRPRTRKERMGMAYREAESARFELRLGMAAMLDKDAERVAEIGRLQTKLMDSCREVSEVRWANKVLQEENDEISAHAAGRPLAQGNTASTSFPTSNHLSFEDTWGSATAAASILQSDFRDFRELNVPLAASSSAVPPFSPARPMFEPDGNRSGSPRLLLKATSQPVLMPPLWGLGQETPRLSTPDKLTLAPLRKVKRPTDWRMNWHL